MIDVILRAIEANFDLSYMIVVNVLTYLTIKIIDLLNGDKKVPTYLKRLILVGSILLVGAVYYMIGYPSMLVLLNSAVLAPVFWSWVAYPILKRFNMGYFLEVDEVMTGSHNVQTLNKKKKKKKKYNKPNLEHNLTNEI